MTYAAAVVRDFPVSTPSNLEAQSARADRNDIRVVGRAFTLLRIMNQRYASSVADLHRMSGLPKPTVCRILATLEHEGYVEREGRNGIYRLASKVHELSAGYNEECQLIDLAAPILLEATRRIKWPLALGLLEGSAMTVRFSTMSQSPMAVRSTTLGNRHRLLRSAMGAAYLAFCSERERDELLRTAAWDGEAVDRDRVEAKLQAARARGYGLRMPEKAGDSATVALPIIHGGEVVAVLALTTFGSLMSERFVQQYRAELDAVIGEITKVLARVRVGGGQRLSQA